MPLTDIVALSIFGFAWLLYEPALAQLARWRRLINDDMTVIRAAWMSEMVRRPGQRILDSQLIGHVLNSASFFASSNLILIAGSAGVLFGDKNAHKALEASPMMAHVSADVFSVKLAVIAIALARGLLSFIWAIRQLNYCVAIIGAAPREGSDDLLKVYASAASAALNPALSAFNAGVRTYYFALAAVAWLFGPLEMTAVTIGAVGLLLWRQAASPAAAGVHGIRRVLEERDTASSS